MIFLMYLMILTLYVYGSLSHMLLVQFGAEKMVIVLCSSQIDVLYIFYILVI